MAKGGTPGAVVPFDQLELDGVPVDSVRLRRRPRETERDVDRRRPDAERGSSPVAPAGISARPTVVRARALPRLSVSPGEAARMLGVSRDFFDEHLKPELRVVRRGKLILIPVAELERWFDKSATRFSR
jgi:excisionase family DNA binding protein